MVKRTKSWINGEYTFQHILKKILECIREHGLLWIARIIIHKIFTKLFLIFYILWLKTDTLIYNWKGRGIPRKEKLKFLYASPVGKNGKAYLTKIIQKFGHEDFDYLIFVYDKTEFEEEIFKKCAFIYEEGLKWKFAKKYLTPEYCKKYEYLFFWDDDIDIDNFSYGNFIEIMRRNNLEMAQPALSHDSYYSHNIVIKDKRYKIGRITDFVEIMVQVFREDAWVKFWNMIEKGYNFWGWGYDYLVKSFCGYKNIGIIDCETVRHTIKFKYDIRPRVEMEIFLGKHKNYKPAMRITYGALK